MNPISFSSPDFASALSSANALVSSVAGTISGNAGWLILIAAASLLLFVILYIKRGLSHLGTSGDGIEWSSRAQRIIMLAQTEERLATARANFETYRDSVRRDMEGRAKIAALDEDNTPLNMFDKAEYDRVTNGNISGAAEHDAEMLRRRRETPEGKARLKQLQEIDRNFNADFAAGIDPTARYR